MSIEKLEVFASQADKNTDGITLKYGFPSAEKPARQWFNWLFYTQTSKINEVADLANSNFTRVKDIDLKYEQLKRDTTKQLQDTASSLQDVRDYADQLMQTAVGGKLAYKTYAEMVADKANIATNSSIDIIADTDDKNGTYLYDGADFVKSQYDIEKLIRAKVQNTFDTYAQMVASNLSEGAYALVADDTNDKNGIYIKEGGNWVKSKYDPLIQAIKFSTVYTDAKLGDLFDISYNLVDPSKSVSGYSYKSTGELVESSGYQLSDFIEVKPDTDYTLYRESDIALDVATYTQISYFDENKEFIERQGFAIVRKVGVVRDVTHSPENAHYARVAVQDRTIDRFNRMMYEGTAELEYQEYYPPKLKGLASIDADDINTVIDARKSAITVESKNIFDADSAIKNRVVGKDGVETDPPSGQVYWTTDYIAVEPSTGYVFSADVGSTGFVHTAFYDKDKKFIERVSTATHVEPSGSKVITTPSNAYYLRANLNERLPYQTHRMIRKVGTSSDYEPHHDGKLTGFALNDDVLKKSGVIGLEWLRNNFVLDTVVTEPYNAPLTWDYTSGYYQQPHAVVHNMFDELLSLDDEGYVTKSILGQDDFGNDIPLFTFKPAMPETGTARQLPKFFVVCGTHGFEQVSPLATYLMMKEVITNWESDPALELLHHNVELLVIPVLNPSGWDDFTRSNRNGVDLNRSFTPDFGWQTTDPTNSWYGGSEPLQEKESQCVKKVFDENPNIIACYDFHNFHGNSGGSYDRYIWIPSKSEAVRRLSQTLITKMTRKWRKDFDWFPEAPYFAGFTEEYSGAMIQDYAMSRGAQLVATLEVCETWWVNTELNKFDATHCKTATEVIVNWFVLNLQLLDMRMVDV